jgi:hypothetical protein
LLLRVEAFFLHYGSMIFFHKEAFRLLRRIRAPIVHPAKATPMNTGIYDVTDEVYDDVVVGMI